MMSSEKSFQYREIDHEGWQTLDAVALANRFNEWMYSTIKPFCKGRVLEIGSGIGNISAYFIQDGYNIVLSDIRENYCQMLEEKFAHTARPEQVLQIDLTDPDFSNKHAALLGTFDTVFALNVVEHIREDELALKNCAALLRPEGHVIILVPAFQRLYNNFDQELEHYRRYTATSLRTIISPAFEVIHSQYFNAAGILGWFFSGSVLRKKTIPKGQMHLYDKLVPFFRVVDKLLANQVGLSVVQVGKKPA